MTAQFSPEIEAFIKTYVKDIEAGVVAVFAGAGLSKSCGFVNWSELLSNITEELRSSYEYMNYLQVVLDFRRIPAGAIPHQRLQTVHSNR